MINRRRGGALPIFRAGGSGRARGLARIAGACARRVWRAVSQVNVIRALGIDVKARSLYVLDLFGRQAVGEESAGGDFDNTNVRGGRGRGLRAGELHDEVEPDDREEKEQVGDDGKRRQTPVAGVPSHAPPEGRSEAVAPRLVPDVVF